MAFPSLGYRSLTGKRGHSSRPALDACRCGAHRFDDEGEQSAPALLATIVARTSPPRRGRDTIRQLHDLGKQQNAAPHNSGTVGPVTAA
jgi:hypothetical protein